MGSLIKQALHVAPYATLLLLAIPFLPVLFLGALTLSPLAVLAFAMGSLSGPSHQIPAPQEQGAPGAAEWELRRHEAKRGEIEEVPQGPSLMAGMPAAERKAENGGMLRYVEGLKKDVQLLAETSGLDVSEDLKQPQAGGLEHATDSLFHLYGIEPPSGLQGPAQERLGHKVKVLKTQMGIA